VSFATLTRFRDAVGDRLDAADVDRLIHGGTSDVRHRSDLHVRTERQLRIARRPASDDGHENRAATASHAACTCGGMTERIAFAAWR